MKKKYVKKYPLSWEDTSPADLEKLASGIVNHIERRVFWTEIVAPALVVLMVIAFFLFK